MALVLTNRKNFVFKTLDQGRQFAKDINFAILEFLVVSEYHFSCKSNILANKHQLSANFHLLTETYCKG